MGKAQSPAKLPALLAQEGDLCKEGRDRRI